LFHDPPKQQAVRGWMLLEHLKLWHGWNSAAGNPFYKKVDLDNVALLGHSRGGEAVATAALFNQLDYYPDDATIRFQYHFPIKSLVAIAPVDGQYKPAGEWRFIRNVNYFTIQGANDGDVSSFNGSRQFDHVRYTEPGPWFKTELYIYRANHGQFNTVWGRSDAGEPLGWFLDLKPLLDPADQRKIAKVYISAFLEATLHNRREYLPMFHDYRRIRSWLPDTLYMNRYFDASYRVISDFSEDADVTTTTVPGGHIQGDHLSIWREGRIPYRQGDRGYNGVFLGWNRAEQKKGHAEPTPVYSISLPATLAKDWNLGAKSVLTMSLAVTEDKADPPWKKPDDKSKDDEDKDDKKKKPEPTDFTVEIEGSDGAVSRFPLSHFGLLPPPFKVRFTKLAKLDEIGYEKESEPIFQTIDLPLAAFGVDPVKIKTIRLRFDRTPMRVVILSQIAVGQASDLPSH
jgi:pimeloyl-ACP methyl ester carboxylesterase